MLIKVQQKRYYAHRLAWEMGHGVACTPGLEIDHINGDKGDNRLCNLREVTSSENKYNVGKHSHNTSGYKGVSWNKAEQMWRASIRKDGKQVRIGSYATPEEAFEAYKFAATELHGKLLNLK